MRTQHACRSAASSAPLQPTQQPSAPAAPRPGVNRLLASLPPELQQRLNSLGSPVALEKSAVLIEAGAPQTHVYFPCAGLLSLQTMTKGGSSVEVAMVGSGGVTPPLPTIATSPAAYTTTVTVAGEALRLRKRTAAEYRHPALQRTLIPALARDDE